MAELARQAGTTRQQIERLEKGTRRLSRQWALRLAKPLKMRPEILMFGPGTAQIVGYIGAGAEIFPVDDHELGAGLDEIEIPPGIPLDAVLVIVRGDSMYPRYFDRELLLYRDPGPPADLVGRECVVKLADGRMFVKILRPGSEFGLFNLESWNANTPTITNQLVEWAAPVQARVNT